jgi:hypothetical protein
LDHIMLVWRETYFIFYCQEHSSFHSYCSMSVIFFYYYVLVSFFALIFIQILLYLCIKVYLDLYSMLIFIKRVILKRLEWC